MHFPLASSHQRVRTQSRTEKPAEKPSRVTANNLSSKETLVFILTKLRSGLVSIAGFVFEHLQHQSFEHLQHQSFQHLQHQSTMIEGKFLLQNPESLIEVGEAETFPPRHLVGLGVSLLHSIIVTAILVWRGRNFSSRASGISDQSSSPVIILCYNST